MDLLLADKVDPPQSGRIHAQLDRQHLDHPFDDIGGLGHPERAAIGHATRRLVGMDPVHPQPGHRNVIGTGADRHEAGGIFGRVGAGVKGTVVGGGVAPQAGDLARPGVRDLARHPVVAGNGDGHQVAHPPLDPLHRPPGDDGGHDGTDIAGIDPDLVAKAAADIGRDDADVAFGNARQLGRDGAHDMRRQGWP